MEKKMTVPLADGFRMPGEFEKHRGCVLIWPVRPGSWTNAGAEAKKTFTELALAIAKSEEVWMLCDREHEPEVKAAFGDGKESIHVCVIPTDDAWARDIGPTCVVNKDGEVRGVNWEFNAWGGTYDGLYADWKQDDLAAERICEEIGMKCYDAHPFVLEGGSIHSDGEGTVLVTEACLLSPGRNPSMSREEIEEKLCKYLGAKKILWLPHGIYGDETNEHVDNACAFVRPGEVVLAWTEDTSDVMYRGLSETLAYLESVTDACGRKLLIHKLPLPKKPVCITAEELAAMEFAEGEDMRTVGERLAASYVNFYIANGSILLPQFGDENDAVAAELLGKLFPGRTVERIYARPIIVGGGNIHCVTQQIP